MLLFKCFQPLPPRIIKRKHAQPIRAWLQSALFLIGSNEDQLGVWSGGFIFVFVFLSLCRNKFVEFDMKPVCKKCYEKFPLELKKRLKKLAEAVGRK